MKEKLKPLMQVVESEDFDEELEMVRSAKVILLSVPIKCLDTFLFTLRALCVESYESHCIDKSVAECFGALKCNSNLCFQFLKLCFF